MGKQSEGVGIALEVGEVVPECGRYLALEFGAGSLEEISLHGLLATMTEGRIAQIVGKAGGGHYLPYLLKHGVLEFGMALGEYLGHIIT